MLHLSGEKRARPLIWCYRSCSALCQTSLKSIKGQYNIEPAKSSPRNNVGAYIYGSPFVLCLEIQASQCVKRDDREAKMTNTLFSHGCESRAQMCKCEFQAQFCEFAFEISWFAYFMTVMLRWKSSGFQLTYFIFGAYFLEQHLANLRTS